MDGGVAWQGSQGESAVYENKSIEIVRNHHHPYKLHSCCNIFLGPTVEEGAMTGEGESKT